MKSATPDNNNEHPRILISAEPRNGLRHVSDIRKAITGGRARELWNEMLRDLEIIKSHELYNPGTSREILPGRDPHDLEHRNPDWALCTAAGNRITYAALAALITDDPRYLDDGLRQLESILDTGLWPDWRQIVWRDPAQRMPADLRTGMLAKSIGLAYDWAYHLLTEPQREVFREGLRIRAFEPYWQSVEVDAWWVRGANNFTPCIAGGVAIAAMCLGNDGYPRADELVDHVTGLLEPFLDNYGPDGEFNESVGYAGATQLSVEYWIAENYYRGGINRLARSPFPEFARWWMHFLLPGNRYAALGDGHVDVAPASALFAALAQANREPIFQWQYLRSAQTTQRRQPHLELLWHDPTVQPENPEGKLPHGRVFKAYGGCVSSRSGWNSDKDDVVVYGKAGAGYEMHGHHDAGQVCIDGHGERLIVDLGSTIPYGLQGKGNNVRKVSDYDPAEGLSRWGYYPNGVAGHNILAFGRREMRESAKDR
ncbi:MAG: hypothetical protein HN368_02935, partial [Spirochaetales bacterium]|nr:hypothetical protein [Spirochaetales bacterium]